MASSAILFSAAAASGGGGAPNLLSIVVANATPTQMTLTYDAALDTGSVAATTAFIPLGDGVTKLCTNVNVTGSTVVLTFDFSFYFEESILLFYLVPATSPIRASGAGASVAAITAGAVTNNITATGTIYYVDPATGSDANAGTSQGSPWKTIPGLRNTADTNWQSTTYGGSGAALAAGSRVRVKAGSLFDSAIGGRLYITSTWWANGTAKNPSVVQVADDWGTGDVTFDGTGITVPQYFGFVATNQRNYIHLRGVDGTKRINVQDDGSQSEAAVQHFGGNPTHSIGCQVAWLEVLNGRNFGVSYAYQDDSLMRDFIVHDVAAGGAGLGVEIGGNNDARCINVEYRDGEVYNVAVGGTGQTLAQGCQTVGSLNCVYRRVTSHDNRRDGFDHGSSTNTNDISVKYIDCYSYNNGEDGFACNGCTDASGGTSIGTYINCRVQDAGDSNFTIYEGGDARMYHCTADGSGTNLYAWNESGYTTRFKLRNCYFGKSGWQNRSYQGTGGPPEFVCDSDYNAWVATTALTDDDFIDDDGATVANYNTWAFFGANETSAAGYRTTTAQAFIDAVNGNFNLANDTGTCANRGTAIASFPAECRFDGSSSKTTLGRLRNATTPDLGAYEYAP